MRTPVPRNVSHQVNDNSYETYDDSGARADVRVRVKVRHYTNDHLHNWRGVPSILHQNIRRSLWNKGILELVQ